MIDFVAGDDVWVAVGVAGAIMLTGGLARLTIDAWWLLPLAVPAILAVSLLRLTRPASARRRTRR
ncbi:MAG: hypothetical protein MSC30_16730 [Gaiellaceae bacterium MAG52_C11]|nr:hypothetical protein [Candidatus Gaiellasilicea maunaloa]